MSIIKSYIDAEYLKEQLCKSHAKFNAPNNFGLDHVFTLFTKAELHHRTYFKIKKICRLNEIETTSRISFKPTKSEKKMLHGALHDLQQIDVNACFFCLSFFIAEKK